jgi:predicted DNA-binding ribbon-helix-helix protein
MRLDRETWSSLTDICQREKISLNDLCSKIDSARGKSGLSSATRLFVLMYFRYILSKYEKQPEVAGQEFSPEAILQKVS